MLNQMNPVYPRPYTQRGNGNYNAGNNTTDKDGHNSQEQDRRQQESPNVVARGRAEDVQQGMQAPIRPAIYSPAANAYSQSIRPMNYTAQGGSSYSLQGHQINPQQYQSLNSSYQQIPVQQEQMPAAESTPSRNNRINIAQILKDFRNTMKAIATPKELEEDVNKYLLIVENLVKTPNPQVNIIQSNLKIAASMLDRYISETLKKESKVVQNWLDALFLQRINYSYDEGEINPNFLVQFPNSEENRNNTENNSENAVESKETEVHNENIQPDVQENEQESEIEDYNPQTLEEEFIQAEKTISHKPNVTIIPQDTKLKSLFMEAKKQAFSNNPQKAMTIFKEAFGRAEELRDNETQSRICLEIGKIYDDNDFVVQALNSYNKSLQYTTDTDVKSKAHFSIAQIYDDINQIGAAIDHYITSISYACKTDNLISQSDSLTRVANIFTDKYDESAFDYYDVARKLIEQTTDDNMKGYVLSNTADACVHFRKNDKALKYYAEAVKNYEKTNSSEEIAENYKSAAELMIQFNSPNKARSLLKKAMVNAVRTSNEDLVSEINLMLASVS